MPRTVNRAIIYTRVSADRAHGRSVAEQEADCRRVCEREGWPIEAVLTDNDRGASRWSKKTRPAFQQLRETLSAGTILVFWEASRVARDARVTLDLIDEAAERQVLINYSGRTYNPNDGNDRFSMGIDALVAAKASDETRDRVLRSTRASAEKGEPHGRVPYGYKAVHDQDTGRVTARVPHDTEAPIVREVVARVLAGDSLRSVAANLDARGVSTPGSSKRWRPNDLGALIRRPVYAGLRTHHGVITEGTWEPLISLEEHYAVVALLGDPSRKNPRGTAPVHLLSGIAQCGVCGSPVRRLNGGRYPKYQCVNAHVARSQRQVDRLVRAVIVKTLADPDFAARLADTGTDQVRDATLAVRAIEKKLADAADAYVAGEITVAMLARIEAQLEPKLQEAKSAAVPVIPNRTLAALAGPDAGPRWDDLPIADKRDAVRSSLTVKILPTEARGRSFDPHSVVAKWK
ncbi:recombinase family protein [Rhodococcus sp. D2-41]|uniref:recombinase family protein n=1 Tax=Speluncibacter jeojiensis TaxID=2710754 RepID=UPI0024109FD3|nr:recombinase family protein [Rhodococcus sp. D2-41]MDG3012420.1 recombinase family protein [Rhodococcus sp. D2-41]